jgi:aspartate aminotransferase-like enzyme
MPPKPRYNRLMIRKTRLFTPGPTPLLPAAQFAMAAADIHHRTAEFRALYTRVLAQLKDFVGTTNDVLILASSGTGAMEASVSNLTSPGDRVVVLTAGKFGERWTGITKAFGCEVDVVSAPYGSTFSLDAIKAALKLETRVVFVQATESSTGVRHDVQAIGQLLKDAKSEALFVVDAITGIGTTHLDMDAWGIDVLIGGSQKALMIPPGLSYLAVSPRAWDRMEASYNPRYYFDLRKERKNALKGESAYTPSVALIAAMGAALDWIAAQADGNLVEGRKKLVDNAETCAAMTRAAATAMGLKLFAPKGYEAAAATGILPPEGVDSGAIVKGLRSKFAIIVTDGQGEMKGSLFRIAHIGFFDYMDTIAVIGALEQVAAALKLPISGNSFGTGLIAAQKEFAERTK